VSSVSSPDERISGQVVVKKRNSTTENHKEVKENQKVKETLPLAKTAGSLQLEACSL